MFVLQQMNSSQTIRTGNESSFMESIVLLHLKAQMENQIILQGISIEQLADKLADSVLKKIRTERKDLQENVLLTVKDVCSELKVSRQTIHAMRKDGRLNSVTLGGRGIRFHREDIEQMKTRK